MPIGSLKSHALNVIVQHLCLQQNSSAVENLRVYLKNGGYNQVFSKKIFECMIGKYPLLVSDEFLLLFCHAKLRELHLKGCKNLTLQALQYALCSCINIKSLDLSECDQLISMDLLPLLECRAQQLQCFKVNGCATLTDEILQGILQRLPCLTELSCEGCDKLYFDNSVKLTNKLATVNVSGCRHLGSSFVRHLCSMAQSNLQSLNLSGTSVDCTALVYLSGYPLSSAIHLAISYNSEKTSLVFEHRESIDAKVDLVENIFHDSSTESTLSSHMKKVCAYCSKDIAVRKFSECIDSINIYSITDSINDYDIIDSQVVNIFNGDHFENSLGENLLDHEWAILSYNDLYNLSDSNQCCCSIDVSDENRSVGSNDSTCQPDKVETGDTRYICKQKFVPNITSLDISHTNFCDKDIYNIDIAKKSLDLFLNCNRNLKNLFVGGNSQEVTDDMLKLIAMYADEMVFISLVGCIHISNQGVMEMADKFKNLRAIDLTGVSFVTDEPLIQLVAKHNQLKYISLAESYITDHVLEKMAISLQHTLQHLDLSWCENITDRGVMQIMESCKKLTHLDLRQCDVSSTIVKCITLNGSNVVSLGLSGIKGLNDKRCIEMVKSLPRLVKLDLSWNSSLTDDSISKLCYSCLYLREIILSGLKRITSAPFLPVISDFRRWHQMCGIINFRLPEKYTDFSSYKNKHLREISRLQALEPDFYLPFRSVNYLPELRKLTLGYCDKVNDNHLSEIVAVCRGTLMIEDYYGAMIQPAWNSFPKGYSNHGSVDPFEAAVIAI